MAKDRLQQTNESIGGAHWHYAWRDLMVCVCALFEVYIIRGWGTVYVPACSAIGYTIIYCMCV